jgi:hypothetical protein
MIDQHLRRVVRVQLNLVDSWCCLEAAIREQLLQVLDRKVGDTNVLDAARLGELLELGPGVKEVPVGVVLLEVIRISG